MFILLSLLIIFSIGLLKEDEQNENNNKNKRKTKDE